MPRPRPSLKIADFDVTPMIDVTMLLIIFFVLTVQFAKQSTAGSALPREKGDTGASVGEPLVLDVLGGGRFMIRGVEGDVDSTVAATAGELAAPGERKRLLIRVDRASPAAELNALARKLRASNIREWRIATTGETGTDDLAPGGTPAKKAGGS
ncbi:MAG: biopolymer transporter ExbD [Planctomycetes bacterium]|nr:biopolymer transporter ExbD [Planctomycetota bacterium]